MVIEITIIEVANLLAHVDLRLWGASALLTCEPDALLMRHAGWAAW
jgi:hypothetical protein